MRINLYALNIIIVVELHSSEFKGTPELNNTIVKRDHDLVYLIILPRIYMFALASHYKRCHMQNTKKEQSQVIERDPQIE